MFLVVLLLTIAILCSTEIAVGARITGGREQIKEALALQKNYLPVTAALFMSIAHLCLVLTGALLAPFGPSGTWDSFAYYWRSSPLAFGWATVMLLGFVGNFCSVLHSARVQELNDFFPRYLSYCMFTSEIQTWLVCEDMTTMSLWKMSTSGAGLLLILLGCYIITAKPSLTNNEGPKFVPWDKFLVNRMHLRTCNSS